MNVPTSSNLNDSHCSTQTGMDLASHSSPLKPNSPPKPNHSPTQEPPQQIEQAKVIVIYSTACTPSPSNEHSYAHEAQDPPQDQTYIKRLLIKKKRKIKKIQDLTNHYLWQTRRNKKEKENMKETNKETHPKPS